MVLPPERLSNDNLWRIWRAGARALALPVRVRRLRIDHLLGHDDRPNRILGRHPLLGLRVRFHLSDPRPLVLGAGWIPRAHGQRRTFPSFGWVQFPRLRRLDGGSLNRRMDRPRWRGHAWPEDWAQVQA